MSVEKLVEQLERLEAEKADLEEIVDRQNHLLEQLKADQSDNIQIDKVLEVLVESVALNMTAVTNLPRDDMEFRGECFRRLLHLQLDAYKATHPNEPKENAWEVVTDIWRDR